MDVILPAIISGAAALLVCIINNAAQARRAEQQHNATVELIEYKLDQLTKKVELHNNAVERLYKVEQKVSLHDERLKVANHRIEDLEKE